jgi:hypothetical protein
MENIKIEWDNSGYLFESYKVFYKNEVIFTSSKAIGTRVGAKITIEDKEYTITGYGMDQVKEGEHRYWNIFVK